MNRQLLCLAGNPELQDRLEYFTDGDRLIIALADGAGGMSGAAEAAEAFIRLAGERKSALQNTADCERLLHDADRQISEDPVAGETTAIVVIVTRAQIFGASAGDSEAWLFSNGAKESLTKAQVRKPLLGSGAGLPVSFDIPAKPGVLLIASDGLWKYTSVEKIEDQLRSDAPDLPNRLVKLVRLRSGALQDDIALAIIPLS